MSAIVIVELKVSPLYGYTLIHADDDSKWTVARNDCPDDSVTLTPRMVAESLDALRNYEGLQLNGYGRLWEFTGESHVLEFRAAMSEGEAGS